MRVVLLSLSHNPSRNAHTIKEVMSVLVRAVYVQTRTLGGETDLETALMDAADLALDRLALEPLNGNT